jgi:tRNA threonylcarbamoyladenosine biosynthesis protein TsaB
MFTLAIETSATNGSLALFDGGACVAEKTLQLGARHGQALIPELGKLFEERQRVPRDCGLTAVSVGPGSFTGLRVGIVCAKIWAYVTGCRLTAVDTHLAIAANSPADVRAVHVVSPSQGGDLFFSRYTREEGAEWSEQSPLQYLPADAWLAQLTGDDVLSGPALAKLAPSLAGRCRVLPEECWVPAARNVGLIGLAQHEAGQTSDPWELEPRYLRRSSAEEKWDLRRRV